MKRLTCLDWSKRLAITPRTPDTGKSVNGPSAVGLADLDGAATAPALDALLRSALVMEPNRPDPAPMLWRHNEKNTVSRYLLVSSMLFFYCLLFQWVTFCSSVDYQNGKYSASYCSSCVGHFTK